MSEKLSWKFNECLGCVSQAAWTPQVYENLDDDIHVVTMLWFEMIQSASLF